MTAVEPLALLDQIEQALAERMRIPSPDSDVPATDDERISLQMDALWTEDDYPEYSQAEVLRAYRLGAEDQRMVPPALRAAAPKLLATVRAVLALADSLNVDSCDPMPDDRARLMFETAERIRAAITTSLGGDRG